MFLRGLATALFNARSPPQKFSHLSELGHCQLALYPYSLPFPLGWLKLAWINNTTSFLLPGAATNGAMTLQFRSQIGTTLSPL